MQKSTLRIKNQKGVDISKGMMGLFYEDINYCCDGGLNAQMIENPSFEFLEAFGYNNHYSTKFDGLYGWIAYPATGDDGVLTISTASPYHKNQPHFLRFSASNSQRGVANKAFEGIAIKKGQSYKISAYLRSEENIGKITASIFSKEEEVLQCTLTTSVSKEWKRYEVTVISDIDLRHGKFVLTMESVGTLDIDHVSMKPEDAVHGVFRADIANILRDMKPGFLRFPGGCIVEGNELSNRYKWKETVGVVESRIPNWNRWAVHNNQEDEFAKGPYSHYNQTLAIGYYEYFLLCEYIGAKPIPVQNVGLACQYQTHQLVPIGTKEFDEYVDDVLDLIEFANGDSSTHWGALRAKMGHPEPFGLDMIGIGNEQWESEEADFFARYTLFEKAIHEKYPEMKLIGSAGPDVTSSRYTDAWDFYKEKQNENPNFTYAVDEHYYRPVEWLYENNEFYDNYPRNIKVFAGEYAAHIYCEMNRPDANTLEAGLSEAAFLTGVERNADVVILASYAPLFARVGFAQWSPNLIWFDDHVCYGTPSYYVQKMYAHNMGDYTLISELESSKDLYQSVSLDVIKKEIIIKLINGSDNAQTINLDIEPAIAAECKVQATILTNEDKTAYNHIDAPEKVVPYEKSLILTSDIYEAPANSFTVLRIPVAL